MNIINKEGPKPLNRMHTPEIAQHGLKETRRSEKMVSSDSEVRSCNGLEFHFTKQT